MNRQELEQEAKYVLPVIIDRIKPIKDYEEMEKFFIVMFLSLEEGIRMMGTNMITKCQRTLTSNSSAHQYLSLSACAKLRMKSTLSSYWNMWVFFILVLELTLKKNTKSFIQKAG